MTYNLNRDTAKLRYPIKPQTEMKVRTWTSNQSEAILRLRYKEIKFEEGEDQRGFNPTPNVVQLRIGCLGRYGRYGMGKYITW